MPVTQWSIPESNTFILPQNQVHIWRLPLDIGQSRCDILKRFLSEDELERARRFRFDKHRNHFIAARGNLRLLLGKYISRPAASIKFNYNAYGKPELEKESGTQFLHFNISHSHQLALMGFCRNFEIGVDIEWQGRGVAGRDIARRFFSAAEAETLFELAPELQDKAFFDCWSRKEAYIKARGKGLAIPLDQFDVVLNPADPVKLLKTAHDPQAVSDWTLKSIDADPQYSAAIAGRSGNWDTLYFDGQDYSFD